MTVGNVTSRAGLAGKNLIDNRRLPHAPGLGLSGDGEPLPRSWCGTLDDSPSARDSTILRSSGTALLLDAVSLRWHACQIQRVSGLMINKLCLQNRANGILCSFNNGPSDDRHP
jgi:hypothetical protein